MNDCIKIRGLLLRCRIGVPEQERGAAQELRAHLTFEPEKGFPDEDDIAGTVDYDELSRSIQKLASQGERKLIETLASDIADHVLKQYAVKKIQVELEKYILPEADWVGVVLQKNRESSRH